MVDLTYSTYLVVVSVFAVHEEQDAQDDVEAQVGDPALLVRAG